MRADRPASTLNFPQRTVIDGLANIITTGNSTKVRFPRVEPLPTGAPKDDGRHMTTLGYGYVNEIGRQGFKGEPFAFPVGTIIVRERLLTATSPPDRLVVMIKQEKRFNRKANGWEFLTVSGDGKKLLKRERDGKCLTCHASAAQNDFVFQWRIAEKAQD